MKESILGLFIFAHQGGVGWDELLIIILPVVLVVLGIAMLANRRIRIIKARNIEKTTRIS